MSRLRKYDESEILDKSMALFWEKGFLGTSLKDLEKALNLKAPSIYHGYGNKESLFLKVIEHYLKKVVDERIETYLKKDSCSIQNIKNFFLSLVEHSNFVNAKNGCLLTNTATEIGSTNSKVSKRVESGIDKINGAILLGLEMAQKNGELKANVSIKDIATVLSLGYQGLLVSLRLNYSNKVLKQNTLSLLKVLD